MDKFIIYSANGSSYFIPPTPTVTLAATITPATATGVAAPLGRPHQLRRSGTVSGATASTTTSFAAAGMEALTATYTQTGNVAASSGPLSLPVNAEPAGFRQASSAVGQNVPSISTMLPNTPACGDTLIAERQEAEGTATTTGVTDGNLSFALRDTVTGPSPDNAEVAFWTLLVPCGVTPGGTITATPSNNPDMGIAVMEYGELSGAIAGFNRISGYTSGHTTTVMSGVGAADFAGDLVLGFEADSGWQVKLAADTSGGYTARVTVENNPVAEFLVEDQVAAPRGFYSATTKISYTSATAGGLMPFGFAGVPFVIGTIVFAHS
jgi:hypothetical protein